jgi:hypothetical protein
MSFGATMLVLRLICSSTQRGKLPFELILSELSSRKNRRNALWSITFGQVIQL